MAFFDWCVAAIRWIVVLFVDCAVTFLATFEYTCESVTTTERQEEAIIHMKRTFFRYITLDIVILVITWVPDNPTTVLSGLLWPFVNAVHLGPTVQRI